MKFVASLLISESLLLNVLFSLLAYFSPIKDLMFAIVSLYLFDFCTGIWRSIIKRRRITSFRLRKSISKITAYLIAIICCHIVSQTLIGDHIKLPQIIAGLIGATELLSIIENLAEITGDGTFKNIYDKLTNYKK